MIILTRIPVWRENPKSWQSKVVPSSNGRFLRIWALQKRTSQSNSTTSQISPYLQLKHISLCELSPRMFPHDFFVHLCHLFYYYYYYTHNRLIAPCAHYHAAVTFQICWPFFLDNVFPPACKGAPDSFWTQGRFYVWAISKLNHFIIHFIFNY